MIDCQSRPVIYFYYSKFRIYHVILNLFQRKTIRMTKYNIFKKLSLCLDYSTNIILICRSSTRMDVLAGRI